MKDELIWDGRQIRTMGDTMDAVIAIAKAGDRDRARAFLKAYSETTPIEVVRTNIGYGAGYYDRATAEKIFDIFEVEHPIFGRKWPTPEEAFELGKQMAQKRVR